MKKFLPSLFKYLLLTAVLLLISGCSASSPIREDQLTVYDLELPGLTREYTFLFLTDLHTIIPDENETRQVQDYAAERLLVLPPSGSTLEDWVSYANRQTYDGLLLGGDIVDFPSSANLAYLDASLKKLSVPYLYTPGNHDWTYPWEYMTEKGRETYLPLLAPYMDGNTAIHTLEYEDLILVAINNSSNQIDPEALDLYRRILQKKKPVVLLLHIPLYTEELLTEAKKKWNTGVVLGGGIHGGIYPDQTSTEFLNLTLAADSPVAAVLSGHVHFGKSSVLKREKNDISMREMDISQITGNAGFTGHATVVRLSVLSAQ